jgi:thiaminase/transcriptional activator TenA
MKFSDYLWQQNAANYQRIISHPFNLELAKGTLSKDRFIFYLQQDAYYLMGFSRALALIAGRVDTSRMIQRFLNFALGVLVAERELHATFLAETCDRLEPSPACLAYTRYLIAIAATASLEEAVAAILPCFWIYREVGRSIAAQTTENNPYISWIDTYSSQEFSEETDEAISILDELASQCSANTLTRMENAFISSSLLEWHFWNDAYEKILFREVHGNGFFRAEMNRAI